MSVLSLPVASAPSALSPAPPLTLYRLSVDQYHAMLNAGILVSGDPIELLEGILVRTMTVHPPHRLATRLTRKALERILPPDWYEDGGPITTADSEPEPDLIVVRGDPRQYGERHPGPMDLALVVEVSDSTLRADQTEMLRIYARAAIAVYWIVNLVDLRVEVYTDPTGPAEQPSYRQRQDFSLTENVPVVIEGREVGRIAVQELMP